LPGAGRRSEAGKVEPVLARAGVREGYEGLKMAKGRESGMPDEESWREFFNPE
jgi:hypothetical protein